MIGRLAGVAAAAVVVGVLCCGVLVSWCCCALRGLRVVVVGDL